VHLGHAWTPRPPKTYNNHLLSRQLFISDISGVSSDGAHQVFDPILCSTPPPDMTVLKCYRVISNIVPTCYGQMTSWVTHCLPFS